MQRKKKSTQILKKTLPFILYGKILHFCCEITTRKITKVSISHYKNIEDICLFQCKVEKNISHSDARCNIITNGYSTLENITACIHKSNIILS